MVCRLHQRTAGLHAARLRTAVLQVVQRRQAREDHRQCARFARAELGRRFIAKFHYTDTDTDTDPTRTRTDPTEFRHRKVRVRVRVVEFSCYLSPRQESQTLV